MVYLSLYRRQRPLTFSEMTGQEHVARTLSHALARGQLAHAYLFCGPRGTGKTTAAKIMARAVNCINYPAPEPCGECMSCRNIAAGVSMDVIEMDAASNRGIEEIRELRERTRYASSESRFKVYIIDEAHMLTHEACNAFLKTLEEPPPGVIFILATTDPSRLPSTIVSRCQRFNFHLLTPPQIMQRLRQVVEKEGWKAEDEALQLMARLAEGSLRDALGLLEQCRAYGEELITAEHVRVVTGATRTDLMGSLIKSLAESDLENAINVLQQVTYSGRDLALFLKDLTYFFSRLLLINASGEVRPDDTYYGFEELLRQFKGRFTKRALLDIVELLHQVSGELRHAHNPQFILEITLIRILRVLELAAAGSQSQAANVDRGRAAIEPPVKAEKVEQKSGDRQPVPKTASTGAGERKAAQKTASEALLEPVDGSAAPGDLEQFWSQILIEVKKSQPSTCDYLEMAQSRVLQGTNLVLTYRKGMFAAERIGDDSHRRLVEGIVSKYAGEPIRLKVVVCDAKEAAPPPDTGEAPEETGGLPPSAAPARQAGQSASGKNDYLFDEALKLFRGKIIE